MELTSGTKLYLFSSANDSLLPTFSHITLLFIFLLTDIITKQQLLFRTKLLHQTRDSRIYNKPFYQTRKSGTTPPKLHWSFLF